MSPNKSKTPLWVWIVVAIGALVLLPFCCCAGCNFIFNNFASGQMEDLFADNPIVVEHLGELETLEINHSKTAELKKREKRDGFVMDATGSKGKGEIVGFFKKNDSGFESVQLRLPSGEKFELIQPTE